MTANLRRYGLIWGWFRCKTRFCSDGLWTFAALLYCFLWFFVSLDLFISENQSTVKHLYMLTKDMKGNIYKDQRIAVVHLNSERQSMLTTQQANNSNTAYNNSLAHQTRFTKRIPKLQKRDEKVDEKNMWFYSSEHYLEMDMWDTSLNDDRILAQLAQMSVVAKTLPKDTPVKNILAPHGGCHDEAFTECPVNSCQCIGSHQVKHSSDVDVVIVKSGGYSGVKRNHKQIWIYYQLEGPQYYNAPQGLYNWTATFRSESTIVAPYERFTLYDPKVTKQELIKNYATGKTKKVAWFVSNCGAKNNRLQYANELGEYIGVDIYGSCGPFTCGRNKHGECEDMLSRDYKFYLSFENQNCHNYITEKFFRNGLLNDVIPIVMGAPKKDYIKQAPPHSFIHVSDFKSPKELAEYLHILDKNDTLYNEYFRWKGTGVMLNTLFWCRLCSMVHAADYRAATWYPDLQSWWADDQCEEPARQQPQDTWPWEPPPNLNPDLIP